MKPMTKSLRRKTETGFSLVELMVVVGMIGILAAIGIPAIGAYIHNYRIKGAAAQVAGELQTARSRAIKRNATLGVVLLIVSPTSYRYVIEDDMTPTPTFSAVRNNISTLLGDPNEIGPVKTLPPGIVFNTVGPTIKGLRFGHLGTACNPGSTGDCANNVDSGVAEIVPAGTDWLIRVADPAKALSRNVRITPSGRITTE